MIAKTLRYIFRLLNLTFPIYCLMIPNALKGNVVLPAIFSDNMVLQQSTEVTIWGWAKPLEKVTVTGSWQNSSIETVADNEATWAVKIQTPAAGGPYVIDIKGYNHIVLRNVLIGEVWLCSGQSNMEWTARMGIENAQHEVEQASFPNIRFVTIDHRTAVTPQIDISSEGWKPCSPETMIDFSAVAYFFARKLQHELNVPIGLINASWGGTPAEAWTAIEYCENADKVKEASMSLPDLPWGPEEPGCIYHAMIAPLARYRIAGVIWYQGEANVENPEYYAEIFPTMIGSWRNAWGYIFPFYYAQIAPYQYYQPNAGVLIRDAQRRALSLPETAMVVTSDIGNTEDIHPMNKQDVGIRMANIALNRRYEIEKGDDSGPLYKSFEIKNNKIVVRFEFAEGLHAKGDTLTLFEIAGTDKVFYPAEAAIEEDRVVLSSAKVLMPVAVRFAWSNAAEPNLLNRANLPASCFRTDDWDK